MNTGAQRDLSLLIVEASRLFVERLRDILDEIVGINVAAVVDTEDSGLAVVRDGGIDLILLDLDLRQGSGLGLLRAIARLAAPPPAIVVANYDVARYRHDAMAWGAKYFLDKTKDMDQLPSMLEGIRKVQSRDDLGPSNFA
jgi:two-component system, OmpR family, response regulator